jgi:putative cell wall-binding protein
VFDDVRALAVNVRRVFGQNRFETASAISRELPPSAEVLVAEGGNPDPNRGWPDALSAAGLGAARGLPILLVTTESLPDSTRRALQPDQRVTIVGGTTAVGGEVQAQIDEVAGIVGRIAGDNRYATSARVADDALRRGVDPAVLYLATGLNYPDGLAAGAAAGAENGVLLLVDGQNLSASPETRQWLADHQGDLSSVRLAGGTDAITAGVEQELIRLLG